MTRVDDYKGRARQFAPPNAMAERRADGGRIRPQARFAPWGADFVAGNRKLVTAGWGVPCVPSGAAVALQ